MGAVIPSRQMWQSPFAEEAARKSAHVIDDASVPATVKHLAEPTNNASFSLKQTGELTERAFSADPRHASLSLSTGNPVSDAASDAVSPGWCALLPAPKPRTRPAPARDRPSGPDC